MGTTTGVGLTGTETEELWNAIVAALTLGRTVFTNQNPPTCEQCGGIGYTLPRKSKLIGNQNTLSRK